MNPMLAEDWVAEKQKFPVIWQPKIDGVRALHLTSIGLTGRSLKRHKNIHATNFFSQGAFRGFDGEMAAEAETHDRLCNLTGSALSTIAGEPWLLWHVFDYIDDSTIDKPYEERLRTLEYVVARIKRDSPLLGIHLKPIRWELVHTHERLEELHTQACDEGYEGSCLRKPDGKYKQGRSTVREGGLLRIKDFVEEEAVVTEVLEGQRNGNEATIGADGYTERSTHAENMHPNGMVGKFTCIDVKTGKTITVAAGKLPHDLRKLWFEEPHHILRKTIKYKTFLKGVKNLPRFPTFQSVKIESDM